MENLYCSICFEYFPDKYAYNDHLNKKSHKYSYLVRSSFYHEVKERTPKKYLKQYKEHYKACEESNKRKN